MQMGTKARRQTDALPSPEAIDIKRTALLLDVDGTLLDIAATPYSVVVPPSLRKILSGLIELSGGAVALVSGRTIETLDGLFAPLTAPAIGGHGAEIRVSPHGPKLQWLPPMITEPLRRQIHLLARVDPHVLVEDKPHSIAVHYRLALQQETFLMKEVATIVSREPAWRSRNSVWQGGYRDQAHAVQQGLGRYGADDASAVRRPGPFVHR